MVHDSVHPWIFCTGFRGITELVRVMLPWLLRSRLLRRPAALLGAACTSVLFGVFVLNKVLVNSAASCAQSCGMATYPSYERLQKNEASRKLRHPVIKGFDVNFLGSNSPIEDRFVVGSSVKLGAAMFSLIDGHKGHRCSHYLQKHILKYIASSLHKVVGLPHNTDFQIALDMNSSANLMREDGENVEFSKTVPIEPTIMEECLRESFVNLDSDISEAALADIKMVRTGHSFTTEMKERVLTAIEGACAIAALVQDKDVFVANTGDCRVIIGQQLPDGTWRAIPLSHDQNAHNEAEVERLKSTHPGEENTVILQDRVLGSLMPFRTFGDVDFKWEKKYLEGMVQVWPNYLTPPYVIAEPVITKHRIQAGDKFMILASDGLWERISNEDAVNVVVQSTRRGDQQGGKSWFSTFLKRGKDDSEECCLENAATQLLWHALGGTDEKVTELLNVDKRWSRMFRDDITIIVAYMQDY